MNKLRFRMNALKISSNNIASKILEIRGLRVMLDRDLASLYGVETRTLNQAVMRNQRRFPSDFMLTLERNEIQNISQIVICSSLKHSKRVLAFTEQGVAMLSSVLRSPRAIDVNIEIMRAFAAIKTQLLIQKEITGKLDHLEQRISSHDEEIAAIFEAIRRLVQEPPKPKKRIGFHPQQNLR